MPTLNCAICNKSFSVTEAQYKLMQNTVPCCSQICAEKVK